MNLLLSTLVRYSRENMPMLVGDRFQSAVDAIWDQAGREKRIVFDFEILKDLPQDLIRAAISQEIDAIKVRNFDKLSQDKQVIFAKDFNRLKSHQFGKFVFTYTMKEKILIEISKRICTLDKTTLLRAGLREDI